MGDWTDHEVELIVADYFSMLTLELAGQRVNKSEHRKRLLPLLNKRSEGSIEFKHQNISAALAVLGQPFISGYKPRYNFQRAKIFETILRYQADNPDIYSVYESFTNAVPLSPKVTFENWIVEAPKTKSLQFLEPEKGMYRPIRVNYLEREQENAQLGIKGEELAFNYEKWNLRNAGKNDLADSVEWVSKDRGDGMGFDILSKNLDGTDKYIEVKTTKLSKEAPFFFTSAELRFSVNHQQQFHLYRIFDVSNKPKMFTKTGRYDEFCRMEPVVYTGIF